MKININNKETTTGAATLSELAATLHLPDKGVAIAVNNIMIPRTEWANSPLRDGDDIVILKAFSGG